MVKELRSSSIGESLPTLFLTSLLDKKGQAKISEETTLKLEGVEYPAVAKPFKPVVLVEVARRLAGDPVIEDSIQVEVEKSVETQAKEAEAAIESKEAEEKPESESEEAATTEEAPKES